MEVIHACRDIEVGEELLTSYISPEQDQKARKSFLSQQFGFLCACEACSLVGQDMVRSDKRRKALRSLDNRIYASISQGQFSDGLKLVQQKLEYLREEKIDIPCLLTRAEYDAYQACKHAGQHRQARAWLEKAAAHNLQAEGDDSPTSKQYQRMLRLPLNASHNPCF